MRRLMDWGVDGLISDYPDRARTVMAERKLPLPAPAPRPAPAR
jgi:glycerophosphoryl diester phosphodiesterase